MIDLDQLFDEMNAAFWHSRKPKYKASWQKPSSDYFYLGLCNKKKRTIFVNPDIPEGIVRRVLLHEMCHIGCDNHGKRFLDRLKYLADKGEAWANEEHDEYIAAPTHNQLLAQARQNIEEWALSDTPPTFDQAVTAAAAGMGLSPEGLLRRAPWIKATYERASRQAERSRARRADLVRKIDLKSD